MSKVVKLDEEVPKPLEALTEEKIAEENRLLEQATLEERFKRLEPRLPFMARWRLSRRAAHLHRQLNRAKWNALVTRRAELWALYVDQKAHYLKLVDRLKERPTKAAVQDYRATKSRLKSIIRQGRQVQARITALQPLADEYSQAMNALKAHNQAVAFEQEERQNAKAFAKEARGYEKLLTGEFRRDSKLHFRGTDRKGRYYTIVPHFQHTYVTSDSIWYLLQASRYRSFPPGWVSVLPDDVNVLDLMSDETLENMKAVTGREVRVVRGKVGGSIFFVVNRLDSPDGLPRLVLYHNILPHYPTEKHALVPYPIGVSAGRKVEWLTFGELPSMLIAGSSQTGKSNLINAIISTLVSMNSPEEIRVLLIDMKGGIEFTHFAGIPHLLVPIVKKLDEILPALKNIVSLMQARQEMLAEVKQKNILEYNAVVPPDRRLARIIVVTDEMATIMRQGKVTEDIYQQLNMIAAQGRATGIHCVLCTQYSSTQVIPAPIKANLAVRITGATPSGSDSMTVIGSHAAKKLPTEIRGRMLLSIGANEVQVQTPYISNEEIAMSVSHAKEFEAARSADELDILPEITPPAPIDLTERERAIIEYLHFIGTEQMVRTIAQETQIPRSTVGRLLVGLAEKGLVTKGETGSYVEVRRAVSEQLASHAYLEQVSEAMTEVPNVPPDSDVSVSTEPPIDDEDTDSDIPAQLPEPLDDQETPEEREEAYA